MSRQRLRRGLILCAMLTLPATLYYFSPVLPLHGASLGIVVGSLLVFAAQFMSALVLGRAWCGWLCPAGGLQEVCTLAVNRRARGGRLDLIKWIIWLPWVASMGILAAGAGGFHAVDFAFQTNNGLSLGDPASFCVYTAVVGLIVALALAAGRRAFCHYGCWMAPFMIIGARLSDLARLPALRLRAKPDACIHCGACTRVCPMSLGVEEMVRRGSMTSDECVLCGSCVDGCPSQAIAYVFATPARARGEPG